MWHTHLQLSFTYTPFLFDAVEHQSEMEALLWDSVYLEEAVTDYTNEAGLFIW